MTKKLKIMLICALFFMLSFILVGYAALNDELTVVGESSVSPQNIVFITDVKVLAENSGASATVNGYTGTLLDSQVTLAANVASSITFQITVFNGTNYTAYYQDTVWSDEAYDNAGIDVTTSLNVNDAVQSKGFLTFTATYAYKDGVISNRVLNSLVSFKFSDELTQEEQAVDGALERFDDILNNETEQGTTFEALRQEMTGGDGLSGRNDTYIGNVIGSSGSDSQAVNKFFTDATGNNKLVLEINGVKTSVTVMIKYEDVTGDGVADMTIYMTPDKISGQWYNRSSVTVYAAVFTSSTKTDATGQTKTVWSMIGQLYKGTATTNAYSGNIFGASDSFNTDTWKSAEAYHGASSGETIESVMTALKNS